MPRLTASRLQTYRARTFRLAPSRRVKTKAAALKFVNERGFIYFWPIKNITLPSLWAAVAGDRPVADKHDDPGHVTWGWKDEMLDKRQWYYAKVLRGKATIISLDVMHFFYALSANFGDPTHDYLEQYEDGLLSQAGKAIFEVLLKAGPLDTVNLRRAIHMTSKKSNSPFSRGLTELQRDFKILPVGVARTGAWHYSFIYDLVHRHYPDLTGRARAITRKTARQKLVGLYFDSVGAATAADVRKLFQWKSREIESTLASLVEAGALQGGVEFEDAHGEHFTVAKLAQ